MIGIQIVLIVAAALIGGYVFANLHTQKGRAWKRILLFIFIIAMILAILFPDTTTQVASWVGVGRGADLLLYGLAIAFVFFVFNVYVKFQQQRNLVFKLARKIAIADAEQRYKDR
jgi:small membrane protein